METLYRSKPEGSYDLKDMRAKGFGSRLTVMRRVERGELQQPFKMGNAQNSQYFWDKNQIDELLDQLKSCTRRF